MRKKSSQDLIAENQELQVRLEELQETLDAIRRGEVDALVVSTSKGEQVYTTSGAEKPYRVLIEEMREGAVMISEDNAILYCNKGFAGIVKSSLERIVGINIESMISPTHKHAFAELLSFARTGKGAMAREITLQTTNGTLVPALMSVNMLQTEKIATVFLVVTDLTEHMEKEVKRYTMELELTQIALSESEERYRRLFESMSEMFQVVELIYDGNGKAVDYYYREVNHALERLTGKTKEQLVGHRMKELFGVVEDYRLETYDKVVKTGKPVHYVNYGAESNKYCEFYVWKAADNECAIIFTDITERKKAEDAIRRQASLIDLSPDAIMVRELEGAITFWSQGAERLYGWTMSEAVGQPSHILLKTRSSEPLSNIISQIKISERWSGELYQKAKDGRDIIVQSGWLAEKDEKGGIKSILESNLDITERKMIEERLKTAQRFVTIGETAAMVGHDLRNPLQGIVGRLAVTEETLKSMKIETQEKNLLKETFDSINSQVKYMDNIVSNLQDYAAPVLLKPVKTDIRRPVKEAIAASRIPANVEAALMIPDDLPNVNVDPQLLRRILVNLISNAVQAMPEGGKLTLCATVDKEPNFLLISVEDTGLGIAEKDRPNIFKPLFTTKAKGQGFGLAVCKKLVENLGGTITFDSEVGKGTRFLVRIPK
jgi:PAS domain S-box-containing protein